ncbi:MAG: 2-deoxyribose-5-phosphate aldolase [Spirochaetota bacterium]
MKIQPGEIARSIDYHLLHPSLTDEQTVSGCAVAAQYGFGAVTVKPHALSMAVNLLKDNGVLVGTAVSFPHGNSDTRIKEEETLQAIRDGADEVSMVANAGKALGGNWEFIEYEIAVLQQLTSTHHVALKVMFDNHFLGEEEIIELSKICSSLEIPYVVTSTGYGFVSQSDGLYSSKGAAAFDAELMRHFISGKTQIEICQRTIGLDELLALSQKGAKRFAVAEVDSLINAMYEKGREPKSM